MKLNIIDQKDIPEGEVYTTIDQGSIDGDYGCEVKFKHVNGVICVVDYKVLKEIKAKRELEEAAVVKYKSGTDK